MSVPYWLRRLCWIPAAISKVPWRGRPLWLWNALTYLYEFCDDCGRRVGPCTGSWWHADDDLWLEVMGLEDPGVGASGRRIGPGCLCPPCFTARARSKGISLFWHARAEFRDGQDVQEGQRLAGLRQ